MQRYRMERVYLPTETLGSIYAPDGSLVCKTMELPWKNNAQNISCIPEGVYVLKKMQPGFGRDYVYFRFMHVPGRNINRALGMSTILIHKITYVKDLQGCIGVGGRHVDLNKDGVPDMIDSGKKLQWMAENMPEEFELEITKKPV
jgi:hypothetical protein